MCCDGWDNAEWGEAVNGACLSKPQLRDLPEWACWIAQGSDGQWMAYEGEPVLSSDKGYFLTTQGSRYKFLMRGKPNPLWETTLERVRVREKVTEEE